MTVTNVEQDVDQLSLTVTSEFAAAVDRVWQVWADPRRLERWWGPPTHPATFVEHDFTPGGVATYYMTGPAGEKYHGWWRFLDVDAPHTFRAEDGFSDENGVHDDDMPTNGFVVQLEAARGNGTRMTITTRFPSAEAMQQLVAMGMVEGLQAAMGQIDDVLSDA